MTKDGMRRGDSMATGKRQVQASTHAVTVDGGNRRSRKVRYFRHESLARAREAKCLRSMKAGDLVEVGPGREEVLIPRDDQALRRILREMLNGFSKSANASTSQSIRTVFRYKAQNDCIVFLLNLKQFLIELEGRVQRKQSRCGLSLDSSRLGDEAWLYLAATPRGLTLARMKSMIASMGVPG